MLSGKHRLRRDEDIKRVLHTGERIRTRALQVSLLKTTLTAPARVSVVAGKRVHASAIVRHKVQRLLREIVADVLRQYPTGYDMVVVAGTPAAQIKTKAGFQEEYQLILKVVSRI